MCLRNRIGIGSSLKKDQSKTRSINGYSYIDVLLMINKGIRRGICHAVYWHAKASNKYLKNYDKIKESSFLKYWDVNNLYWWAMSGKFPEGGIKWVEETYQFNEDFMKRYNKDSHMGYFIEPDVQYLEKLHKLLNDLPVTPEITKIEKVEKFVANFHD